MAHAYSSMANPVSEAAPRGHRAEMGVSGS
ncbi:hypothetical protein CGLO_13337 [Colletotrichum gloeosporioides Cg-14]|uniref:Uncharacterized protein n=1 Tax=Colletotrichum gloeosporioides (strain Cg-14) TaxID=1237896 RepID=T0L7C4_COLGC|nr:hypothetical protein CGLO_13337 [Colletotrichum gloeosporioides Cg-14]